MCVCVCVCVCCSMFFAFLRRSCVVCVCVSTFVQVPPRTMPTLRCNHQTQTLPVVVSKQRGFHQWLAVDGSSRTIFATLSSQGIWSIHWRSDTYSYHTGQWKNTAKASLSTKRGDATLVYSLPALLFHVKSQNECSCAVQS